ncbi:hypothetical protein FP2506_02854 [Fulvimarina pelagi HTCC2506]|uniref:DUF1491 family protein n=2 Tax=Fulvimarina pelagi TaxID=217511 RepID=Q0G0G2_9HYPH|nr:DUF1491 family protein [Fulvimarina pelagi]EAU40631.1 hypothetical protein FP2506_02854 [Fulvimarina pelagi HTCC2506]BAT31176.1 hypothetical protein [Fulvimarina pelagi]
MRITSELFVSQLMRRVFNDGGFAAVERKGAESAGAIYIVTRDRLGQVTLYAPAFQSLVEESGTRAFVREAQTEEVEFRARFEREARFDPDFWLVEIETSEPEKYLEILEA